jgi:hypothetical protein
MTPPEPPNPEYKGSPLRCWCGGASVMITGADGHLRPVGLCHRHYAGRVTFTDVPVEPAPHDDDTQPGPAYIPPLWCIDLIDE